VNGRIVAPQGREVLTGILFMCLAVNLFPLLNAASKYLSTGFPIVEIVWARYIGHLVFILLAFYPRHRTRLFRSRSPWTQAARSVLLLLSTAIYFVAIAYVPLTTAAAINFVAPLLVTALSVPLLGEQVGIRRWTAILVGFAGALIIVRPGGAEFHWAASLVFVSAGCSALYQVLTRKVAAGDSPETSITLAALTATLLTSLVVPFYLELPGDWLSWALFLSLGVTGGFGHYFLTRAYTLGPASVISPFGYVQLIGATALGFAVFGDFPDRWTWVGAAVIVASGLYVAAREARLKRAPAPRP